MVLNVNIMQIKMVNSVFPGRYKFDDIIVHYKFGIHISSQQSWMPGCHW